ncbi:MAG: hypothetical protein ACQGVK_06280 [Myxococcota bacterium]
MSGADPSAPTPASASPARPTPSNVFASLTRLERELEAEWTDLQDRGYGFSGVQSLLAKQAGPERSETLGSAAAAQAEFLDRLDAYQRIQQTHFMEQVTAELDRAMETLVSFYGRRRARGLARRHARLQRLASRYAELEPLYGTPRDHQRIAVYQRFYAGVVAFSKRIRALDPTMPESPPPSLVDRAYGLARALGQTLRRLGPALRMGLAFLRALVVVFARRDPTPGRTGTPFTGRVDDLFRAWGDFLGYRVEVSGRERLPDDDGATIQIFAPAHRHGVSDNVTFAHLGLRDYLVFNAVDQLPILPRFLKDRMAETPGLIAVGGGRGSAVERALAELDRGVSRNLLIYPEGSVSEGFRGTRPPRPNFGDALVPAIRDAGLALRIVPVTYPDNARFLDLPERSRAPARRRRRVVVGEPLESASLDALARAGGGAFVNRMVRLAWLEQLARDDHHFLGMDRAAAIEARLDLELDGIRYWGSLESAPTPDLLTTDSQEPVAVSEEPFRGKRVRVFTLPGSAARGDGRIPLRNLEAPDSKELLVGIRPPSHIYVSVGRQRFDGDILRPLAVKERDTIFSGIIIRFVGVPVKSIHAIRRKLEEYAGREQRTLTCANSACRLIARAANLEIDDHADYRPFLPSHVLPTRTIRKLIERGVRNHAGEAVEIQIYKTDDRSLEAILAEARRQEIQIAWNHLELLSVGLWRALSKRLRRARGRDA